MVLFLLGTWALSAQPAAAQQQTLTGWFSITVADYPPESDLAADTTYGLTDAYDQYHDLLIDIELLEPLGGPMALNHRRVTVMGEWEQVGPDATAQFRVYSIDLDESPSTASSRRTLAPDLSLDETATPWSTSSPQRQIPMCEAPSRR